MLTGTASDSSAAVLRIFCTVFGPDSGCAAGRCVMAAPLLIGSKLTNMTAFDLETYTNKDAILVDQLLYLDTHTLCSVCIAHPLLWETAVVFCDAHAVQCPATDIAYAGPAGHSGPPGSRYLPAGTLSRMVLPTFRDQKRTPTLLFEQRVSEVWRCVFDFERMS
eukprot:3060026-Rhodomonas_salina.2